MHGRIADLGERNFIEQNLRMKLKNNIFTFKEKTLKQIRDTAIGTKFAQHIVYCLWPN